MNVKTHDQGEERNGYKKSKGTLTPLQLRTQSEEGLQPSQQAQGKEK